MPEKTIPARNGGFLNNGGTPGNKGGYGRPKDEIRALAREAGNKAVERLKTLLEEDDSKLSAQEIRSITDVLLKYGVGTQQETELKFVGDNEYKLAFIQTMMSMVPDIDLVEFQKRLEAQLNG